MVSIGRDCNANSNLFLTMNGNCSTDTLEAILASCSSRVVPGCQSAANFEDDLLPIVQKRQYYPAGEVSEEKGEDDGIDDSYLHRPEKKRRLTVEQVKFLEKSFEIENKLEPDRKLQLAKDLNLQPRQVAVWFQNRRARWKTKQLEKDYDTLNMSYDALKADYDLLLREKEWLQAEIDSVKGKLRLIAENKHNESPHSGNAADKELSEAPLSAKIGGDTFFPFTADCQVKTEPVNWEASSESKRETSMSSGDDESTVFDASSPHPIESRLGPIVEEVSCPRMPLTSTEDAPDITVFGEGACSKVLPVQSYQQFVKIEGGLFEDYPNYYYSSDEQGTLPWWN
eukprot:c26220_g2_i2 orf=557-1579(+)